MFSFIKSRISLALDYFSLIQKYWKYYISFFFYKKKKLYRILQDSGCRRLRPVHRTCWKVWYNSFYFSAIYNKKKVFVKVTGPATEDGYYNEIIVNQYIEDNSDYLFCRTPKLLLNIHIDDFYILIYNFAEMQSATNYENLHTAVMEVMEEYSKIGIIHMDFKFHNISICNGKYWFFDYGYSLCPESTIVRIATNNHISYITDSAREIINNPTFYYDDVINLGLNELDRSHVNFLVGKDNTFYAKLGQNTYQYELKRIDPNRSVYLLHKV